VASEASAGWTVKRRLAGRCHVTAAAAASGGGNCIHRLLQGKAEGQGAAGGRLRKQGRRRAGNSVVAAACLALSLFSIYMWWLTRVKRGL
jgi:hypothetical protein